MSLYSFGRCDGTDGTRTNGARRPQAGFPVATNGRYRHTRVSRSARTCCTLMVRLALLTRPQRAPWFLSLAAMGLIGLGSMARALGTRSLPPRADSRRPLPETHVKPSRPRLPPTNVEGSDPSLDRSERRIRPGAGRHSLQQSRTIPVTVSRNPRPAALMPLTDAKTPRR